MLAGPAPWLLAAPFIQCRTRTSESSVLIEITASYIPLIPLLLEHQHGKTVPDTLYCITSAPFLSMLTGWLITQLLDCGRHSRDEKAQIRLPARLLVDHRPFEIQD